MFTEFRKASPLWDLSPALVTPVARQVSRLMREEVNSSAEFDSMTYLMEVVIKFETTVTLSILQAYDESESLRLGYALSQSDGLGSWPETLTKALVGLTTSARTEYLTTTQSFTQKFNVRSADFKLIELAEGVWTELEESDYTFAKSRLGLLQFFVALRNRTRGHGATTASQYERINSSLLDLCGSLVESSPFLKEDLVRPMKSKGEYYSCRLLRGFPTQDQIAVSAKFIPRHDSIYFSSASGLIELPDLFIYLRDDDSCFFLNSKRRNGDGDSEFLDYFTNQKRRQLLASYQAQPTQKPNSITAGLYSLDWDATIPNNLPRVDFTTYVSRPQLEEELSDYLTGKAVNFVSLEGQGGAGKTTLALWTARQIVNGSSETAPVFDFVVWLSARDVDLDEAAGPLKRRRQVTSLNSCCELLVDLLKDYYSFSGGDAESQIAEVIASGNERFLLIFDNFESFDDTPALQQFIKRHLAFPSKALMTSREDAFHGDVPINVGGLKRSEASDLMRRAGRQTGCEPKLDERTISKIYESTLGNPYAIKLLINELCRAVDIDAILPRVFGEEYLAALFRRSFERLDEGPAYLFLMLGISPMSRFERLLRICSVGRSIEYETAKRILLDFSLLDAPDLMADSTSVFRVSWAASQFAKRVLTGHRMQRETEQDIEFLKNLSFNLPLNTSLRSIYEFVANIVETDPMLRERNGRILSWIRENDSESAAKFAISQALTPGIAIDTVRLNFKRAVELNSDEPALWLRWANFENAIGDISRALDLVLRSVDLSDLSEALDDASSLMLKIMSQPNFKQSTQATRKPFYTRPLIARYESRLNDLSPTSLSRLGWLYLQTNDRVNARRIVKQGLALDGTLIELRNLEAKLS